jgi:UDP-2-acetamido-2,6-beta-L-arabino-hexul-4-ose reductase
VNPGTRVLLTGSRGFIGKNLLVRLRELGAFEVLEFTHKDSANLLPEMVAKSDVIVHLAGANRPSNADEYSAVNVGLTQKLCDAVRASQVPKRLILSSSAQATLDNPYGLSKRAAERVVERLASEGGCSLVIYRLPGVFGKWCRPNYNSVVATFCHNVANELPIHIDSPDAELALVYIDDVIEELLRAMSAPECPEGHAAVSPVYSITVGELANQIQAFKNCRSTLVSERVGTGLGRALYATYVSYLPAGRFSYDLKKYVDSRGTFVEMLKTLDSGQFSYFTAYPGITRGGHYHHSKSEKFLIVKGKARFGFRNLLNDQYVEVLVSADTPQIVDTIPGWVHDITNVGDEEMIVLLWANEAFNRDRPDTIARAV